MKNFFGKGLHFNLTLLCLLTASSAFSDVLVVTSKSSSITHAKKEIRDLYLGRVKSRKIELLDQAEGQAARTEFNEKFLGKSDREIRQQRSILVFSGNRVPKVIGDDRAVLNHLKFNPDAIGYIDGSKIKPPTLEAEGIKVLFVIQ